MKVPELDSNFLLFARELRDMYANYDIAPGWDEYPVIFFVDRKLDKAYDIAFDEDDPLTWDMQPSIHWEDIDAIGDAVFGHLVEQVEKTYKKGVLSFARSKPTYNVYYRIRDAGSSWVVEGLAENKQGKTERKEVYFSQAEFEELVKAI